MHQHSDGQNPEIEKAGAAKLMQHNARDSIYIVEVRNMPMNTISISRRRFAQLLGAGAACAVARPALSFAGTLSAKPVAQPAADLLATAGVVRLSSNEN